MESKINFIFTVMLIFTILVSIYFIYLLVQAFKERLNEDEETKTNQNENKE